MSKTETLPEILAELRDCGPLCGRYADRIKTAMSQDEPVAWQAKYRGVSSAEWMDVSQYAGMEIDPANAQPAAKVEAPSIDHPACSGDPASCPENEGYGCCKPNPVNAPASVPDGWLPIESAPKDGSNFLQFSKRRGVTMNHWHTFTTIEGGSLNHVVFDDMPTHWKPLPAPPTNQEGAAP